MVSLVVSLCLTLPLALPMFFSIFFYQSVSLRRSPAHSEDPCRRPDFWGKKKSSFSSGFAVTRVTPLRLRTAWPHVGAKRKSEILIALYHAAFCMARVTPFVIAHITALHADPKKKSAIS